MITTRAPDGANKTFLFSELADPRVYRLRSPRQQIFQYFYIIFLGGFQNTKFQNTKINGGFKIPKDKFKIPKRGVQNTKKITMNKALSKWISIKVATFKIPTFIIPTK